MRQVTITGGAGFIGVNSANHFLEKGFKVTVYDNLGRKGCSENLEWLKTNPAAEHLEVVVGDVREPTDGLRAAVEVSEAVFHFAGQVAVTTSVSDPVTDFGANALGTFNMLELIRHSNGAKPAFLFSSTNKVYGGMEDVVIEEGEERYAYRDFPEGIPENRTLDFHSPYGCSKGAADQYVRDYARIYGLKTVVFRQSCIYGYRQFGLEDQGWVAWFVIAAMLRRPITIYGDGKQVRDVLFVEDLLRAYDLAVESIDEVSGRIYNIGGGPRNTISLRDLIGLLRERIDSDLDPAMGQWRPGDQPVYISDIRKAETDLGWTPRTDWQTGVGKLIDWVGENREMLERMF